MRRRSDTLTVQTFLATPFVIIVLAYRRVKHIMIARLVFRQDQTVDLITSGLYIMRAVLIHARLQDCIHFLLAVQLITPVVRVRAIQYARLHMQLRRMFDYRYLVDGITSILVIVFTGISIGLSVEIDGLIVADGEEGIYMHHLFHRQIHPIPYLVAVVPFARESERSRLFTRETVPCITLTRTYDYCRIDRIDMIDGQIQTTQRITTEAVREHGVVHT